MRIALLALSIPLLLWVPPIAAESIEGLWLSEQRTPAGMGKALEFSADGRMRLSQGLAIGEQWILQGKKRKRYTLQILDPSNGQRLRTIQLEVDDHGDKILIETDLADDLKSKMAFVSRGEQEADPPFLGRWQFMLPKFGIVAVYEYTEDGWLWLRAPIGAEVGGYRLAGDRIVPEWQGEFPPVGEIQIVGQTLVATLPNGASERFLRPKLLETMTPAPANPRR